MLVLKKKEKELAEHIFPSKSEMSEAKILDGYDNTQGDFCERVAGSFTGP
jgi:hypothetical protein